MREWARNNGKSVRQRTVRQETTKYNAGTLPLDMYERKQPIGEKIQLTIPSGHDLNETQLDETCPNCARDHDENQVDEYSDGSDSSVSEMDIDDEVENDLTFLRTTRSGRSITINRSLF